MVESWMRRAGSFRLRLMSQVQPGSHEVLNYKGGKISEDGEAFKLKRGISESGVFDTHVEEKVFVVEWEAGSHADSESWDHRASSGSK